MPFDLSGNYTRLHNWEQDRNADIKIQAVRMDEEFNDIAASFNKVFFRNGLVPMTGPLRMGDNPLREVSSGSVSAPGISFAQNTDTGIYYTGSAIGFAFDGQQKMGVDAGGLSVLGNINSTGNITVGGSSVWYAGNFNPDNYASKTSGSLQVFDVGVRGPTVSVDTGYYLSKIAGTSPVINFDPDDYFVYDRSNDVLELRLGGLARASFRRTGDLNLFSSANLIYNGNTVWHAGNFAPGSYALLGGTPAFNTVRANSFSVDTQFYMTFSGQDPTINFDSNDYIVHNRSTDVFKIALGGQDRVTLRKDGDLNLAANGNLIYNGNSVWHSGNFTPGSKADLSGAQFSGDISVNRGSGNPSLTLNRAGVGGVTFAMQSDGNFILYRDGSALFNHIGGANPFDFAVDVRSKGRALPSTSRGANRMVTIEDGTAAPSGGGDGDFYFQYTP